MVEGTLRILPAMRNYSQLFLKIILGACPLIFACTIEPGELEGHWQAVAFYENGHDVKTELDSVRIHFAPDNNYEFRSQGFYQETGTYRISASYVFLSDTTVKPKQERIIKILYLSEDSLKIEMKANQQKQVLFFKRKS